ncbi:MAG TPA: YciI family protein [Nevskia sp.]|nr:YciI family protein [Nevskia sp.]
MRLLMMHNTDARTEAGVLPSAELMQNMGLLVEDMTRAGVMLAGVGLRPSSTGVRLNFSAGARRLRPGPYAGPGKLPAGLVLVQVRSIDDAVEWATRLAAVLGDCEIDIRPECQPWDLGLCPRPVGLETTHFMLVYKPDGQDEAAIAAAGRGAAMAGLLGEMARAGVFVAAEALLPSQGSLRLAYRGGRRLVTDGPFAESKELIGGYCMIQVDSIEQALPWSDRFAGVVGDVEADIRQLYEAPLREAAPSGQPACAA